MTHSTTTHSGTRPDFSALLRTPLTERLGCRYPIVQTAMGWVADAKLVAAEPNLFTGFDRMIIVTNDINFTGDWATTGPWPYQMPAGFTQPISNAVSVM